MSVKSSSRLRLLAPAALLSLSAVLAACGAPPPLPATTAPAAPAAQPAAPAAGGSPAAGAAQPAAPAAAYAANPKRGGTFRPSADYAWPHLDPHQTLTGGFYSGPGRAFGGLLVQTNPPGMDPPAFKIEPDLAETWQQVNDTTLVFNLRKGAKWHNIAPANGREIVADDVVFSLKRMVTPGFTNAALLNAMKDVEATDKYTVKITLKEPSAPFMSLISHGYVVLVNKELADSKGGDIRQGPVIGTGPFIYKEGDAKKGTIMDRNPDYYLPGLPYVDRVEGVIIADSATRLSAFRTKKVDILNALPSDVDRLKKEAPELQVFSTRNPGSGPEFGIKVSKAPYTDPKVRQAVSMAMDRQAVIDTVFFGKGLLSLGFTVPGFDWLLPDAELKAAWKQDTDGAKKLLAEAGFPNGYDAELIVANYGEQYISTGEQVVSQLAKAGIRAKIKIIDQPTYTQTILLGGAFDHFYIGPISPTPEFDQNLTVYEKGSSKNYLGVDDPALDQKILAQRRELNPEKRKAIFMDIQRDLVKANYRWQVSGTLTDTMSWPYLKDYRPAPAYSRGNLLRTWFDTEDPSYKGRQ